MSRRNTTDPLLRSFLEDYKLNLLKIPRRNAEVGDVYVDTDGVISPPGRLKSLLVPNVVMPPIKAGEKLAHLATTKTRAIQLEAGVGLLEGFFGAIGATSIAAKIGGTYKPKGAELVRFRLLNVTCDSVDPIALGNAIAKCRLDVKNPFVHGATAYYVTVAVFRSSSITVTAEDNNSKKVRVDASMMMNSITAGGNVQVKNENAEELTYDAREPLAFGVELVELKYDKAQHRFAMAGIDLAIKIRNPDLIKKVLVGDAKKGDVFLHLRDQSRPAAQ